MSLQQSAMRGVPVTLQDLVTATGNGTILATRFLNHTFTIKPTGTIATGAVQLESSDNPDDSNTWSPIGGGPIALATGTTVQVQVSGLFGFVRARVSTTVTGAGGKVTVDYVGS